MKSSSTLSIVVPFLNSQKTIQKCINSIFKQSNQNWECILINDGSTDKSFQVIEPYLEDKRFIYLSNASNLGVSISRNIGIKVATGNIILVLDADDEMTRDRISDTLVAFESYPAIGLLAGRSISSNRTENSEFDIPSDGTSSQQNLVAINRENLIFGCPFVHSTVAYRRELFYYPHHVSYNPSYLVAHDYDLYRQISETGYLLALTENTFSVRHETGNGLMDRLQNRMITETILVKVQALSSLLPKISYETSFAIANLLTYDGFKTEEQKELCKVFLSTPYVKQNMDGTSYEFITNRFNILCK